eukprot:25973-Pelagococcus_subviridis.AAC.8
MPPCVTSVNIRASCDVSSGSNFPDLNSRHLNSRNSGDSIAKSSSAFTSRSSESSAAATCVGVVVDDFGMLIDPRPRPTRPRRGRSRARAPRGGGFLPHPRIVGHDIARVAVIASLPSCERPAGTGICECAFLPRVSICRRVQQPQQHPG